MHKLAILTFTVLYGCSGPQSPAVPKNYTPDPYATPKPAENNPTEGDAVAFLVPAPEEVAVPEAQDACVPYRQARTYSDFQEAQHRWLKQQEAARRGWTKLDGAKMSLELGRDGTPNIYGIEIAEIYDDRFVDKERNHWLFVDAMSPCYSYDRDFYIDSKDQVFMVGSDVQCAKTKVTSCGAWLGEGCGRKPSNRLRYYVKVPESARLIRGVSVPINPPQCIEFAPELGVTRPP